jgi:hypothetical protein
VVWAAAVESVPTIPSQVSLSWRAAAGLVYQVQYKNNLFQADWINLGVPIIATNSSLTMSDSDAIGSSSQRFYRLVVSP